MNLRDMERGLDEVVVKSASPKARRVTAVDTLHERMSRANELARRVIAVREMLFGSSPEASIDPSAVMDHVGTIGGLLDHSESVARAIDEAMAALEHIEKELSNG